MLKIIIFILEIIGVSLVLDVIGGLILSHIKNKSVTDISLLLATSLKISDINYKINEANGGEDNENTYVFKDLPHDVQKIIVEYLPASFYNVLGDDAYEFLNNMTSDQIRIFNKSIIDVHKFIIKIKDIEKIVLAIELILATSFAWVLGYFTFIK